MKRIFIIVWTTLCWTAQANLATYTISGTGYGYLGSTPFLDAAFTITSTADTANIKLGAPFGFWVVPDMTATVSIFGVGNATFTIPTENFINFEIGSAGITALDPNSDILDVKNTAFISYDLNSPQGYELSSSVSPLTGTPAFPYEVAFETTAGAFLLSSVSSVTYQADMVPEPSICALISVGLIGLTLLKQRLKTCRLTSRRSRWRFLFIRFGFHKFGCHRSPVAQLFIVRRLCAYEVYS